MKKQSIILGLILTLMTATVARAECPGRSITGYNGQNYCLSNTYMNWWSAFAWCDAIGGTLFDVTADCACSGSSCPVVGDNRCPNVWMVRGDWCYIWTRNERADRTEYAYYLYVSGNDVAVNNTYKQTKHSVMCRM